MNKRRWLKLEFAGLLALVLLGLVSAASFVWHSLAALI